jgi:hypothetical protein
MRKAASWRSGGAALWCLDQLSVGGGEGIRRGREARREGGGKGDMSEGTQGGRLEATLSHEVRWRRDDENALD